MKPSLTYLLVGILLSGMTGCTFPSSQPTVSRNQVGLVQTLELGYVLEVRDVVIDGERTVIGVWGGAAVGAAATNPGGYPANVGEALGQAAGAVAGAVAGRAIEELVTRKRGQELTIQLDNGQTVVVIEEYKKGPLREGDRVQLNRGGFGPATVRLAIN